MYYELISEQQKAKLTEIFNKLSTNRIHNVLANVFSSSSTNGSIRSIINPNGKYNLDFLRGKDSEKPLVALIDKDTHKIVKHIPVDLVNRSREAIIDKRTQKVQAGINILNIQLIHVQMQNAAIMRQLLQITEIVKDIQKHIVRLEKMHDNDLIGSIAGMRNLLLQARDVSSIEFRNTLLANMITVLNEDRGKIEQAILSELEELPLVSKSMAGIYLKVLVSTDYTKQVSDRFFRVEQLFRQYLDATLLLGYAYMCASEHLAYRDVFTPSEKLIKNPNLQKMVRAERMFNFSDNTTWYREPAQYLGRLGEQAREIFVDQSNQPTLEITGLDILEVIDNAESNE